VRRFCSAAATLVVLAAPPLGAAQQADPEITVVLTDHHFRLSAPVEPGRLLWHIKNEGSEPHQALVIRLPEGVSEYGEQAWFEQAARDPSLVNAWAASKRLRPAPNRRFERISSRGGTCSFARCQRTKDATTNWE